MTTADFGKSIERGGSALVLVAVALLTASCGTRVDRTDAASAATGSSSATSTESASEAQVGGPEAAAVPLPPAQAGPSGAAVPTPTAAAVGSSPSGSSAASRPTASGQTAPATGPKAPVSGKAAPTPSAGGGTGSPAPAPGAGQPADDGKKSPLIVATMCNCSGPASSAAFPIVQGGQLWVKAINARGGLNGHPVRQILYDDGADPARYRSQIQDAVERQHAIAVFVQAAPLSAKPSISYLESKGIPVVGTSLSDAWDYESPMYFPQASGDRPMIYGSVAGAAQQLVPAGKTKLAVVYCAEAEQCARLKTAAVEYAPKVGFDVVYDSPVSFAQPDYTASCLAARNAKAQVTAVFADPNSVTRFAASCARQGFRPAFFVAAPTVAERYKDDPNIESYAGGVNVFPFFQSGTPATDEYREALRTQGGGKIIAGIGTATGWVAGKLLEKAGAALPEPPTSEAILKGLWSLQNDDLGGLTHPLKYTQGQTAPKVACWFNVATKSGAWTSPDGFQRQCASAPVN